MCFPGLSLIDLKIDGYRFTEAIRMTCKPHTSLMNDLTLHVLSMLLPDIFLWFTGHKMAWWLHCRWPTVDMLRPDFKVPSNLAGYGIATLVVHQRLSCMRPAVQLCLQACMKLKGCIL